LDIVDNLFKNHRLFGALSFLLRPDDQASRDEILKQCAQLVELKSKLELAAPANKNVVIEKIDIKVNDMVKQLSGPDAEELIEVLMCKSVSTRCLLELCNSIRTFSTAIVADDYLRCTIKVAVGDRITGEDLREREIAELRELASLAEVAGFPENAKLLAEHIVARARHPFWEYHSLGLQNNLLGDVNSAFSNFNLFLEIAISRMEKAAIKTGYLRVIECCQQLDTLNTALRPLSDSIPAEIAVDDDVVRALKELNDIAKFKYNLQTNNNQISVFGYQPIESVEAVKRDIDRHLEIVSVCPTHKSYYELFKAYALIGDQCSALKYLELAQDFNYFIFNRYD